VSDSRRDAGPDRVIHEPARLRIMTILYVAGEADFTFLMHGTELTRGNLSVHLTRLEEAGYVTIDKTFVERRPRTVAGLTPSGRSAFERYRGYLKGLLDATSTD
jgi:DNA-binding MarR family transcriptional regulator